MNNIKKGRDFQKNAASLLGKYFKVQFSLEHPIHIGSPPKEHMFDLVSEDGKYIGESKNYSWTKHGNIPSAKMSVLNEAVFYLHYVPKIKKRFVVMRKCMNVKHFKSLAEYFYHTNKHLLNGILIIEIDRETEKVRIFPEQK
jgi:hypothetical protein